MRPPRAWDLLLCQSKLLNDVVVKMSSQELKVENVDVDALTVERKRV